MPFLSNSTRIAIVALALLSPSAGAQTFLCTPEVAGQLSCQASRQCECRFFTENKMKGTPAGYRWGCNILRGRCGPEIPATIHPYYGPLPNAVSLDRETTVIQQDQTSNSADQTGETSVDVTVEGNTITNGTTP